MTTRRLGVPPGCREVYHLPRFGLVQLAFCGLLGLRRSFYDDCRWTMRINPPLPEVIGIENVPPQGPFVVVANHYERPGLDMHFAGMAVSAAVGERRPSAPGIRWIITSEWHGRHFGPFPIPAWLTRWVFGRVARVYGFVTMPAMEDRTAQRAAALRQALSIISPPANAGRQAGPVGLMPEARGKGILIEARPGSGVFVRMLTRQGAPVVPVALFESGGRLVVRFGGPFTLEVPEGGDRDDLDRSIRDQVMVAIGRLLPERMWGYYSRLIRGAGPV